VVQATISGTPAWTTTTAYSCCGVATSTDRQGIVTTYGYDGLRRQTTSTARGVTTETVRNGLTTDTYRYATGPAAPVNRIASNSRNLAGTTTSSSSPDPSTTDAGTLATTTTATSYQPGTGLGSRTVTTVPGGFIQTTDTYLDGRTASTTEDLELTMTHGYTTNGTGLLTTSAYVSGYESTATNTDWAGRTVTTTQAGASTTHVYNILGQPYSVTDADNVRTLHAYNSLGEHTVSALDINGDSVIDYAGSDQITVTATKPGIYGGYSVMTTTSGVYTANGATAIATVSTSHQTPDGLRSWSFALGVANPASTVFNSSTWATTATNPDGTSSVTTLNADGLTDTVKRYSAGTTPVLIAETSYTYDTLKRPSTTVDSRTGTTTNKYVSATCDAVLTVTDPGGRVTTFAYDSRGRRVSTTLPEINLPGTNVSYASYYPDGKVKATWGSQTYPTYTTYDYAGRRKTLRTQPTIVSDIPTNAGGSLTTWNYSTSTGTLTSKLDNAGKGPLYAYTDAKRLYTRTWESGTVTTYDYTAGQLTGTNYTDNTPAVTITFKRFGRPDTVTQNLQSKIQYTYNRDLSINTEIVSYDINHDGDFTDAGIDLIRTLDRSADTLGRNTGWQLKDGGTVKHRADYTYDTAGRLSTVADAANTFTYGYQYNQATASDPRVGSTSGSKQDFMPYSVTKSESPTLQTLRTYEARRDALAVIENKAGATVRSSYIYTVNSLGQRETLATAGTAFGVKPAWSWGYNARGELVSASDSSDNDRHFGYLFDDIGNRTATGNVYSVVNDVAQVTNPLTYSPNALNQYTVAGGVTLPSSPVPAPYDLDGNLRFDGGVNKDSQTRQYVWDAENRLIEVLDISGESAVSLVTNAYDSQSRRIRHTDELAGTTTLYLYDGWNVVAEYTGATPALARTNTWGPDLSGSLQGAGGVGGLLAVRFDGTNYYSTFDGNGNVSEYLTTAGVVAAHYEYDPFGNDITPVASEGDLHDTFAYRFSTKPFDDISGWYYYGYRYYDPVTGRWPSRDPIGESGGVNLYGFVENDGLNGIGGFKMLGNKS
jgi:RHS repeat-associated protein